MRALTGIALLSAFLFALPMASADVEVGAALRELTEAERPSLLRGNVGVFVNQALPGAVGVAPGWYSVERSSAELSELVRSRPDLSLLWSPPRRLLLDRADGWIRGSLFRERTGLTGRGVLVGIIDSGVDPAHPDLRTADGATRVRWWLDFSRPRAGRHPELEAEYGCTEEFDCAVLSGADIDELLQNGVEDDEPRDTFGHGTHVASLAAGNGLSSDPPEYVGVAPEASLIVARVARSGGGGIFDADVLKAARFVFDRADELGMPAVVNLSLGSDFGSHDGSSVIEQGLSSLVGAEFPGRAIVVAAGNSAGLFSGVDPSLQDPLGVHTEVHVPRSSEATVPIFAPATDGDRTRGTVYVWIQSRDGDALEIGVDDRDGEVLPPLPPGTSGMMTRGSAEISVINQTYVQGTAVLRGAAGAIVVIEGSWPASERFSIRLAGHGTAELWIQSEGDLAPEVSVGALLPRASKEGTINVPGSAPDLIAVGATLNRTEWFDHEGHRVSFPEHGALDDAPDDTAAFFSSAGPNADGVMKPELVAPGANVIGAMSRWADPRLDAPGGSFESFGRCDITDAEQCFVVDDWHAVTGGTSMAAPIVAGAIALLLERDPTLNQHELRALLQSGARPLEGVVFEEQQIGPGALDLEGILLAQLEGDVPSERTPSERSWMVLSASYVRPDPNERVEGLVELRDAELRPVDGFEPKRLRLEVERAELAAPLRRIAPGLYDFAVSAPSGSGGAELELRLLFDDAPIVTRTVPIAVDRAVAQEGVAARGGCAVAPGRALGKRWLLAPLLAVLAVLARRRQRSNSFRRIGLTGRKE